MRLVVTQPQVAPGTSPCVACSLLYGLTCCEVNTRGPIFPMTYAEAQRIAQVTGSTIDNAVGAINLRQVTRAEQNSLPVIGDTRLNKLITGGEGLYLPLVDGKCRYLALNGCVIRSVKPTICAMFPFSKSKDGRWGMDFMAESGLCYAYDSSGGDTMLAMRLFGVSSANLDRLHARWQRDIQGHAMQMRNWRKRR